MPLSSSVAAHRDEAPSVVRESVPRVLVVEDETFLAEALELGLQHAGFAVARADDGRSALELAATTVPDIIVLDIMLPDIDGIAVCRRLRDTGNHVPVLFLTARDTTEDTLLGLRTGGDDYMTKPFSFAELVERVRAVLRRTQPDRVNTSTRLTYADLSMDVATHEVWREDQPVELTATEFALLHILLANAGKVLTKRQLLDTVWSYGFGGSANVVETYISYLRRKLDPLGPPLIQTVRGVGYALRLPRADG